MKLKLNLCLFVALTLSFLTSSLKAQNNTGFFMAPQYPKSPNTTAFSIYGNYPVSYFTGVPDISIPLYTIKSGGMELPVTLSYHASGIKIADAASWAGLGWSVNAGGNVTRTVMDHPDEKGYLLGSLPTHTLNPTVNADLDLLYADINENTDYRPDIFSYSIPGHSGKFFFNGKDSFKIELIPFSPVSIKRISTASTVSSLAFQIQDEYSNTFTLGRYYKENTGAVGGSGSVASTAVSAWMLEKMVSANKRDTISLSYDSLAVTRPAGRYETMSMVDQPSANDAKCPFTPQYPQYSTYNAQPVVVAQELKTIYFKNGKVDFERSATARQDITSDYRLGDVKISIYNFATKTYEVQKTIKFYQSYFGTSGNFNLRLRLDSIQILDKAGAIIQHYRFGYNPMALPAYDSYSQDYWGYYNARQDGSGITQKSLIPQMTVDFQTTQIPPVPPNYITIGSSVANAREPDSAYMQACVLDTIYYPTGGYTIFNYQTNRYTDTTGLRLAGGLRVSSISSYEATGATPIVKTYQYGSGTPIFNTNATSPQKNYGFFTNTATHRVWVCIDTACLAKRVCNTYRTRQYYCQSTADLDPYDGSPVGYTHVTEYTGTPGTNIGKTTYFYNFSADQVLDASMSGRLVYLSNFHHRGQLVTKKEYMRKADGSYQPVMQEDNTYNAFTPLTGDTVTYDGVGLAVGQIIFNDGRINRAYCDQVSPCDEGSFRFAPYIMRSGDNYLTGTTTLAFDPADSTKYTTSLVQYKYDNIAHQQVTRTRHADSRGNMHVTLNKYPLDYYNNTTHTTGSAVLDTMVNQNGKGIVIEKWDSVKNVITSVNSIAGAQLNIFMAGNMTSSVVPYRMSTLSVSSPITNFVPATVVSGSLSGDSRYVQMISFDQYDTKNNIIKYTPRNATPSGIIWDYGRDVPIAQIKNAPTGNTAYTSFEADGTGNWIYSGAPVIDPTAPTGEKVYPLTAGSVTSSSYDNVKANVLSYWSNGGAATVTTSTGISGTAMGTTNGWTYYEHIIPASSTTITISGTVSIDELRLYPVDAQMITYAYAPEGLTEIADTKGGIGHFEYDYFQRLKNSKDWYGNIVNNYGYHTYDQTIGNDAMSGTYTRNNCPPNTTPGSTGFAVAANKYYSSTKASANAEAAYDMNTNGQAKANAVCLCQPITASFTLTNNTGLSGFQVTFSGIATPYNFPSTGSTVVQVPVGTYATVSVNANGSTNHTFKLGARSNIVGHGASWSTVFIQTSGSTDTSITISN